MFPFDSVFYHLVLFAFNCLIFKELCRPLSHRLCLATAFIYYHVLNPLSTLFFKLFSILFFSGDRLADDFAILPPPYPFCQHLFFSSFDFFFFPSFSFFSFFIFFTFLLVAGVWFSSGCYLAGIRRSSGYNLAPIWFLLSFFTLYTAALLLSILVPAILALIIYIKRFRSFTSRIFLSLLYIF